MSLCTSSVWFSAIVLSSCASIMTRRRGRLRAPLGRGRNMKSFAGKVAVVTGGGTGMGRELCRQLAAAGASNIAMCDVSEENMAQTRALCLAEPGAKARVTTHLCDVSVERQVVDFRDQVVVKHEVD